jgi:hypothetical protein
MKPFNVIAYLLILGLLSWLVFAEKHSDKNVSSSQGVIDSLESRVRSRGIEIDSLQRLRESEKAQLDSVIEKRDAELFFVRKRLQEYEKALEHINRVGIDSIALDVAEYYRQRRQS